MIEKRYTVILGLNKEFKEIIDHCKGDKHISVFDFLKQVNEQDKAFKKLKKENMKLKSENNMLKVTIGRNEAYINRLTHTSKWR